jgi:uncharacterized membrane protein YciS (DUF1049 family)
MKGDFMDNIGLFLVGIAIPLILAGIFWKELRAKRERIIKFFKNKMKKK